MSRGPDDVVAIGTGASHGLALKADGTVVAWGDNRYGQLAIPSGLQDVTAIAAGWVHNLAVKSDGTVVAWGDNSLGQATVPPGLTGRGRRRRRAPATAWRSRPTAPWSPGAATATAKGRYPPASPTWSPSRRAISTAWRSSVTGRSSPGASTWAAWRASLPASPTSSPSRRAISTTWRSSVTGRSWPGATTPWGRQAFPPACRAQPPSPPATSTAWRSCRLTPGDTTAPSAAPALDPPANGSGWNNTDVTVNWNWTDDSGGTGIDPANCQQQTGVQGEGVFNLAATCRDLAGNEGTSAIVVKIDRTAPVFDACPLGGPFDRGSGPQAVGPITVDAGISGLDAAASTLTGTVDTSTAGTQEVTFTATDNAGNTAVRSCSYTVVEAPVVEPPACDEPYATVTIRTRRQPRFHAQPAPVGRLRQSPARRPGRRTMATASATPSPTTRCSPARTTLPCPCPSAGGRAG